MRQPLVPLARWISHGANRFLVHVDRLFLKYGDEPVTPPLFIVGVPRSGTTLTYQIVACQLKVGCFIEPMNILFGCPNLVLRLAKPFLNDRRRIFESNYGRSSHWLAPAESGSFWLRWFPSDGELGHYSDIDLFDRAHYETLKTNIESMSRIVDCPMLFKSVYLDMSIHALAQVFPDARFVHVTRDMLMICQSLFQARQQQNDPRRWWSVKPPGYRQLLSQPLWRQVTEQAYVTERILQHDLKRYAGSRVFEIAYERLCDRPREFAERLYDWLEPLGYQSYPDARLPARFTSSKKKVLDDSLLNKMTAHLEKLQCEGAA
jgi:hypothetical protein